MEQTVLVAAQGQAEESSALSPVDDGLQGLVKVDLVPRVLIQAHRIVDIRTYFIEDIDLDAVGLALKTGIDNLADEGHGFHVVGA